MTLRLLAATIALAALPASAHAATVELRGDGTLLISGAAHEDNAVRVSADGASGVYVSDSQEPVKVLGAGCTKSGEVIGCPSGVARVELELGDGDDSYRGRHALPTTVDAGPGDDEYVLDEDIGSTISRTDFRGGPGDDSASYLRATSGVVVSKDDVAGDGRAGDGDNIHSDVERLYGSPHADTLSGNPVHGTTFVGSDGDDVMNGLGGRNFFDAGEDQDGADVIRGGNGLDELVYTERRDPVTVTVDGGTFDGGLDEGDDVTGVEIVDGGSGDDTIRQATDTSLEAYGGSGNDTLVGGAGGDHLDGEIGADTVVGGRGADTLHAADVERDRVDCGGGGNDWVWRDRRERSVTGCRTAGTLDLHATKVSMQLTWTQAGGWRKLRRLAISPVQHGWKHGEIRIDPRHERLTAVGVRLRGRGVVTRSGNRITARFRYDFGAGLNDGHMYYRADATETE